MTVRVLVVEDEAVAAEAHAAYVERTAGFVVAGVVRSAGDALRHLRAQPDVDLVLLDMNLPDGHGLGVVQRLRAEGHDCDVIAVTGARDVEVVRRAVSQGVVLYLLKPFTYAGFRAKLEQYADYRARVEATDTVGQEDVDRMLTALRASGPVSPPKGMSGETLRDVVAVLRPSAGPMSAAEAGSAVGVSRVTARRYLEYLATEGLVVREQRYGGGRPEVAYRWTGA